MRCLLSCAAALVSPCLSHAELTFFPTRAEFEAALNEPRFVEGFDSFPRDLFLDTNPTSVLGGAVVISSDSSNNWPITITTDEGFFEENFQDPDNSRGVDFTGNSIVGDTNNRFTGVLRLDLSRSEGSTNSIGFDYEGAAGAPANDVHHYVGIRIRSADGTETDVRLVDVDGNDVIGDGDFPSDDGFFGVIDPENAILWIELFPREVVNPPNPDGGETYGIDNVTISLPDGDLDGMPDFFEQAHGLDMATDDATADADTDGVSNLDEFRRRLDPTVADSDGDGISDGAEISAGSDPADRNFPEAYDLMVDFGLTDEDPYPMPAPFRNYTDPDFAGASYSAFGTEVTVTPDWPDSAASSRGVLSYANASSWDRRLFGRPLIRDMLVVDTQISNGGNGGTPTRLSVTLGNLPQGTYQWSSMHHDIDFLHTQFIAELSTDGGESYQEVGRFQMTHGRQGGTPFSDDTRYGPSPEILPSTVNASFDADGIRDVVIRFTPLSTAGPAKRVFGINGFKLIQTHLVSRPLVVTEFSLDPETGQPSLTWRSVGGKTYAVESSTDLQQWIEVSDGVESQGEFTTFTDSDAPQPRPQQHFYRVREEK